jgi:hypothetical protein
VSGVFSLAVLFLATGAAHSDAATQLLPRDSTREALKAYDDAMLSDSEYRRYLEFFLKGMATGLLAPVWMVFHAIAYHVDHHRAGDNQVLRRTVDRWLPFYLQRHICPHEIKGPLVYCAAISEE